MIEAAAKAMCLEWRLGCGWLKTARCDERENRAEIVIALPLEIRFQLEAMKFMSSEESYVIVSCGEDGDVLILCACTERGILAG